MTKFTTVYELKDIISDLDIITQRLFDLRNEFAEDGNRTYVLHAIASVSKALDQVSKVKSIEEVTGPVTRISLDNGKRWIYGYEFDKYRSEIKEHWKAINNQLDTELCIRVENEGPYHSNLDFLKAYLEACPEHEIVIG